MTRHAHGYRIRAETPWVTKLSVEHDGADLEPTQQVTYCCDRGTGCSHGGEFTLTLAADAKPQPAWTCRCGGKGLLDGAPESAAPDYSAYNQGTKVGKGTGHYKDMSEWNLLRERRCDVPNGGGMELLEETLAWSLARLRGQAS